MADPETGAAFVLDASALLCLLNREPGAERVAGVLGQAVISAVNFAEVVAKLVERGMPADAVRAVLDPLPPRVVDFTKAHAMAAGELRAATLRRGLSAGDRACLALAAAERAVALTADRAWNDLDLNVAVEQLRPA